MPLSLFPGKGDCSLTMKLGDSQNPKSATPNPPAGGWTHVTPPLEDVFFLLKVFQHEAMRNNSKGKHHH